MKTCRILMPIGGLGAGIDDDAFANGMTMKPDVIAADAGSTDSGPAYLANGMTKYSKGTIKHDLKVMVLAGKKAGIPVLIGSCGTCGVDAQVDSYADIVEEIYREAGLAGRIAKIYTEQTAEVLERKWDEGKIHALPNAPDITRETFSKCEHIVAVMGAEPFIEAVKNGADVVLGGRATDAGIIAAMPLMKGCGEAAAWHGGKTVECGSQCTDNEEGMGAFLVVDEEGFDVCPINPEAHCTPYTVAAHQIYENTNPFRLTEPSGSFLTEESVYTQKDEKTVRVTGSKFERAKQYTLKLEGASFEGYQTIALVGMADRKVMADPEKWIRNLSKKAHGLLVKSGIRDEDYSFNFKAYGYNAVLTGPVPKGTPAPREIGMLLTVTAVTQELADQIAKAFGPGLLHFPADPNDILPSFAFPFSPAQISRGKVCEFKLNHVVDVDDPLELLRIEYADIGSEKESR